jgi:hypothetical protein
VHSVSFSKTPLYSAYFNPTGTCVIASSRQSCFFVHDLGSATTREIFPQKAFFGSNTRVAVKQKEKLRGATVDGSRRELSLERLIVPKYNNGSDVCIY